MSVHVLSLGSGEVELLPARWKHNVLALCQKPTEATETIVHLGLPFLGKENLALIVKEWQMVLCGREGSGENSYKITQRISQLRDLEAATISKPVLPFFRQKYFEKFCWIKEGDKVVYFLRDQKRIVYPGPFAIGKVARVDDAIGVKFDKRVHNDTCLAGYGMLVFPHDPRLMSFKDYTYLRGDQDYAYFWATIQRDLKPLPSYDPDELRLWLDSTQTAETVYK